MTKRTLLLPLLCCLSSISALGQQVPWNCNNLKNNNLICLLPVATYATQQGTQILQQQHSIRPSRRS